MEVIVFDCEADGLLRDATRLWCIATRSMDSRKERFFGPDEIEEGLRFLMEAPVICAHNLLGYDLPLIQRLYPGFKHDTVEDSLILSRLSNPDRVGGHSIAAWGDKLGLAKPDHEDWTQYSEAMKVRCQEDVRINVRVVRALLEEFRGKEDWRDAIRTEYGAQELQNRIEERGFMLDLPLARKTLRELQYERHEVLTKLDTMLPRHAKPIGVEVKRPFLMDGSVSSMARGHVDEDQWGDVMGPFTRISWEDFNLNSPQQVTAYLLSQGWEPDEWNYAKKPGGGYQTNADGQYKTSSPKMSESSLPSIRGEGGKLIAKYRVLTHRIGMIERVNKQTKVPAGWLNEVRKDGRIEAQAIPLGTNTGRYRHRQVVNVPAASADYGKQMRSLFTVPKGMLLSGTDASGLEARIAGHYTHPFDDGAFAREVLEGDIHDRNAEAFTEAAGKEVTRDLAKIIMYSLLYGASARKVATTTGVPAEVGNEMVERFWDNLPGLALLNEETMEAARWNGYIVGLDGRRVRIRSPHSALNALIQSAGAIAMKRAFLLVDRPEDPWQTVCTYHDEAQIEVHPDHAEELAARWVTAGERITEELSLNVPIVFETKEGRTWYDCH